MLLVATVLTGCTLALAHYGQDLWGNKNLFQSSSYINGDGSLRISSRLRIQRFFFFFSLKGSQKGQQKDEEEKDHFFKLRMIFCFFRWAFLSPTPLLSHLSFCFLSQYYSSLFETPFFDWSTNSICLAHKSIVSLLTEDFGCRYLNNFVILIPLEAMFKKFVRYRYK